MSIFPSTEDASTSPDQHDQLLLTNEHQLFKRFETELPLQQQQPPPNKLSHQQLKTSGNAFSLRSGAQKTAQKIGQAVKAGGQKIKQAAKIGTNAAKNAPKTIYNCREDIVRGAGQAVAKGIRFGSRFALIAPVWGPPVAYTCNLGAKALTTYTDNVRTFTISPL